MIGFETEEIDKNLPKQIRDIMVRCGLAEVINYSFINEEWLERLGFPSPPIPLKNPLGACIFTLQCKFASGRKALFSWKPGRYNPFLFYLGEEPERRFLLPQGGHRNLTQPVTP
jgi:hypothetical protein